MNNRLLIAICVLCLFANILPETSAGGRVGCRSSHCHRGLLRFGCHKRHQTFVEPEIGFLETVCPLRKILTICDANSMDCICLFDAAYSQSCDPCTFVGSCLSDASPNCPRIGHCLFQITISNNLSDDEFTAGFLRNTGLSFEIGSVTGESGVTVEEKHIAFDDPNTEEIIEDEVKATVYICKFMKSGVERTISVGAQRSSVPSPAAVSCPAWEGKLRSVQVDGTDYLVILRQ